MSYTTVKELLEENAVEYPEGTIIEWDGRGRFIVGDSGELIPDDNKSREDRQKAFHEHVAAQDTKKACTSTTEVAI